ncbi:MAG: hypothetical protein DHS20C15_22050 [Planctomycetota bacterium]|nr:MAG: hypothetical protein DHS20C15_22050 [Planctomycetota bacterium]
MTDARTNPGPPESKDYWDLVFGQLRRRTSYKLGLGLLTLLYGVAVFAPFLANDLPLVFEGTRYDQYRSAQRLVPLISNDLISKARQGELGFSEWRAAEDAKRSTLSDGELEAWLDRQADAPQDLRGWLGVDRRSLELRLVTMRRQLAIEHVATLDTLAEAADALVNAAVSADSAALEAQAAALQVSADAVRSSLRAAKYGAEPEAGRSVPLQAYRSHPVLESLGLLEVAFMALWCVLASLPLWGRFVDKLWLGGSRSRIRAARRPKLIAVLLVPPIAAALFAAVVGVSDTELETTTLKQALSDGKAEAVELLFPPLAYGMPEQNQTETFRPPTWTRAAEKDAEGYYTTEGGSARVDPATGIPVRGNPVIVREGEAELNAGTRHMLGTDSLGRDMLTRMVWGARISLSVGLVSTVLLVLIGILIGSIAGYFGGWVDSVLSRVIEIFQCFPVFFLILIVVSFLGPSILNIMLAIGLFRWTGVARLVRGEFIRLRNQEFVVASEALGVPSRRTIFRQMLPNAMGPVLVAATFAVASGILTESALSFLGFGVQLPVPSWGSLLVESRNPEYWWIQVFPGVAIFVTVMLYNLVGEAVRDALDPRLKEA